MEKAKLVLGEEKWWLFCSFSAACFSLRLVCAIVAAVCPSGRTDCAPSLKADTSAYRDWEVFHNHRVLFLQLSPLLQLQKRRLLQITSTYLQVALPPWLTLPCHLLLALLHHHLQVLVFPLQVGVSNLVLEGLVLLPRLCCGTDPCPELIFLIPDHTL